MSKNKKMKTYYTYNKILSKIASYYLVIGMRSNGKTYGAKEEIGKAVDNGEVFCYIRRKHKHIVRTKMIKLFRDINDKFKKEYGFEIDFSYALQAFIRTDTNEVVGYACSLEDAMDLKGEFLSNSTLIYFDEFIDYTYYDNEIDLFLNVLSTIIRKRQDGVKVIMTANTIRKNCPYFDLFKIPISKLKQGEIMEIRHQKGAVVRIEYSKTLVEKKNDGKDFYFGFDDTDKTIMILDGAWETEPLNIKGIDGYGWNTKRTLIPIYIAVSDKLYELSILIKENPIAFCRELNNTNGFINEKIKYILSNENRLFNSKKGCVSRYKKLSPILMEKGIVDNYKLFVECFKCDRIVYQNLIDGTEFKYDFEENKYYC